MGSVTFRSLVVVLFAIGSETTVQAQVRVTTGTTATATATPKVVVPIVWAAAIEPVPVSSSLKEIVLNSPTNWLYSKGYPALVLMRDLAGGQQIWRVAGFCGVGCAPSMLRDLPADAVVKTAVDLTGGSAKGALIFAFRPVGTVAPNQVTAASGVRQATLLNGQSLLLNNATSALTVANDRLRLLAGFTIAAEWNGLMSRVLLYPSGQVGVLEEIGWTK